MTPYVRNEGRTYSKNEHYSFTRNKGLNYGFSFDRIMKQEYGHININRYDRGHHNRYERECDCDRSSRNREYGRFDRDDDYDRGYNGNYGQDRGNGGGSSVLPMIIGAVLGLFGGGLLGKKGADNNVNNNQPNNDSTKEAQDMLNETKRLKSETQKEMDELKRMKEELEKTKKTEPPKTTETDLKNTPATGTKDYKVVARDTIFTILQKEKPELSKEELLKLTAKTIEANKTLLDANVEKKPIYKDLPLGQYIEINDELKLILE